MPAFRRPSALRSLRVTHLVLPRSRLAPCLALLLCNCSALSLDPVRQRVSSADGGVPAAVNVSATNGEPTAPRSDTVARDAATDDSRGETDERTQSPGGTNGDGPDDGVDTSRVDASAPGGDPSDEHLTTNAGGETAGPGATHVPGPDETAGPGATDTEPTGANVGPGTTDTQATGPTITNPTQDSTTSPVDTETTSPEPPEACYPLATTSEGIHVSPDGADVGGCGSADTPCETVSHGLARAVQSGQAILYLAQGTYSESVSLSAPVSVYGGWTPSPGAWTRACEPLATTTSIASPDAVGLFAQFSGTAELESLQISTRGRDASSNPGQSRYGIFATGAGTRLEVRDLIVSAGNANHGLLGSNGTTTPASGCDAGNGGDGAPASPAPTTNQGSFTQSGFSPGNGVSGGNGNPGQGGSDGADVTEDCTFCTNCIGAAGGARTAEGGARGCGGGQGTGGSGGSGGGASVGIFAASASVHFGDAVTLVAGTGGNGALGGHGGDGEPGTYGSPGTDYVCSPRPDNYVCNNSCDQVIESNSGISGGDGSPGSAGGDGAGGWSIVQVGTSGAFSGSTPTRIPGQAGVSQGSGPGGTSLASITIN